MLTNKQGKTAQDNEKKGYTQRDRTKQYLRTNLYNCQKQRAGDKCARLKIKQSGRQNYTYIHKRLRKNKNNILIIKNI